MYATLDAALRTLGALALADYLHGASAPKVDEIWAEDMTRPSAGMWVQAVHAMVRHNSLRQGGAFFAEFAKWLDGPGKGPAVEAVRLRNIWAHGTAEQLAEGIDEARHAHAERAVHDLLEGLGWLQHYVWFRLIDGENHRLGGNGGKVQPIDNVRGLGAIESWRWSARLFQDTVYAIAPDGTDILDLSPGIVVRRDSEGRKTRLYIVEKLEGASICYPDHKVERQSLSLPVPGATSAIAALTIWRQDSERRQSNTTQLWRESATPAQAPTAQAQPARPVPKVKEPPSAPTAAQHDHAWRAAHVPLQRLTGELQVCKCGAWQWMRDRAPALLHCTDRQLTRALPLSERRKLIMRPGPLQHVRDIVQVPHVEKFADGRPALVITQPIDGPWFVLAMPGAKLGWRGGNFDALMVELGSTFELGTVEFMMV